MKKIWLVNQYAMPPHLEPRLRTIKFAQYLSGLGYDVTIFASSVMHNMNVDLIEDKSLYIKRCYDNLNFVHIKTKRYNKNGLARVIGLLQFSIRFARIAKKFPKPDILLHTATVPFSNYIYFVAKKLKSQYIVEILDLWPESFVDLGMFKKRNPLIQLAYYAERWQYIKASKLIFSMEGGVQYIIDKKWDTNQGGQIDLKNVYYINNGVDLPDFNYNKANYQLKDPDLYSKSTKKIIYIGSIRLANNLKHLIDAAFYLKGFSDIRFLLYGDGDNREVLEKYCNENNIDNVIFKQKWVDPKYVPYILSQSDLNILNYKQGSFGAYGGSQSKLFQYMASGKPICSNLEMMFCPIIKYNLGIAKDFKNPKEYAEAILQLLNLPKEDYDAISRRCLSVAKDYDYKVLTRNLVQLFE